MRPSRIDFPASVWNKNILWPSSQRTQKWHLAEVVEEKTVEDNPRNVVHTNVVLILADSPEDAYQKSLELGNSRNVSYENPNGKRVRIAFRGLRDLNIIHDA
jgi:hypothetical protein